MNRLRAARMVSRVVAFLIDSFLVSVVYALVELAILTVGVWRGEPVVSIRPRKAPRTRR